MGAGNIFHVSEQCRQFMVRILLHTGGHTHSHDRYVYKFFTGKKFVSSRTGSPK